MQVKAFIKRYSLVFYFLIAFAISWGASLGTLGPKFLRGEPLLVAANARKPAAR